MSLTFPDFVSGSSELLGRTRPRPRTNFVPAKTDPSLDTGSSGTKGSGPGCLPRFRSRMWSWFGAGDGTFAIFPSRRLSWRMKGFGSGLGCREYFSNGLTLYSSGLVLQTYIPD